MLCLMSLALFASGCDGCTAVGRLRVDGDHPYVRCLAVEPTERSDAWTVGALQLSQEGRVLSVEGASLPLRMAAFVGPGLSGDDPATALSALDSSGVSLTWVLGELGDAPATARRTLNALAERDGLFVVLASGRDDLGVLNDVWDDLSDEAKAHVIDARGLRAVRVGGATFSLLSGAPGGRYARNDDACGYSADDLGELADDLPDEAEGSRWLVSWAAPAGGVAHSEDGAEGGDPALRSYMDENNILGGVFAWPPHNALGGVRASRDDAGSAEEGEADGPRAAVSPLQLREAAPDAQIVVGRLVGAPVGRGDGSMAPNGALLLELRDAGLAIVGHAPSGSGATAESAP